MKTLQSKRFVFTETPVKLVSRAELMKASSRTRFLPFDEYPMALKAMSVERECGALYADEDGWVGRAEYSLFVQRFVLDEERATA